MAKTSALLALLVFTVSAARADFTREYRITLGLNSGQVWSGKMAIMILGDRYVRYLPIMDLQKAGFYRAVVIDLKQGTYTEINFDDRSYSVSALSEVVQAVERARQKGKIKPPVFEETDQIKKISGFEARLRIEKIEIAKDLSNISEAWLSSNIPGYNEEEEFQKRLCQQRPSYAVLVESTCEDSGKLHGMPVLATSKTQRKGKASVDSTIELISISTDPVDPAKFEIPADFKKVPSKIIQNLLK